MFIRSIIIRLTGRRMTLNQANQHQVVGCGCRDNLMLALHTKIRPPPSSLLRRPQSLLAHIARANIIRRSIIPGCCCCSAAAGGRSSDVTSLWLTRQWRWSGLSLYWLTCCTINACSGQASTWNTRWHARTHVLQIYQPLSQHPLRFVFPTKSTRISLLRYSSIPCCTFSLALGLFIELSYISSRAVVTHWLNININIFL